MSYCVILTGAFQRDWSLFNSAFAFWEHSSKWLDILVARKCEVERKEKQMWQMSFREQVDTYVISVWTVRECSGSCLILCWLGGLSQPISKEPHLREWYRQSPRLWIDRQTCPEKEKLFLKERKVKWDYGLKKDFALYVRHGRSQLKIMVWPGMTSPSSTIPLGITCLRWRHKWKVLGWWGDSQGVLIFPVILSDAFGLSRL